MELFRNTYKPLDLTEIYESMKAAYRIVPMKVGLLDAEPLVEDDFITWMEEPFKSNELYPESLLHITLGGRKVRSKSEVIIAGTLEASGLPFRYEAALNLPQQTYYPDFTILRPKDRKIFYWEHFGMMNDEGYEAGAARKLFDYRKNGILPWRNLITTYDDESGAIDVQTIHSIVNAFLLDA